MQPKDNHVDTPFAQVVIKQVTAFALKTIAVAALLVPVLVPLGAIQASATDGTVVLTDVTAPNLVGDSNVGSQSDEGPDAFMIASEYCNTHSHVIYDVTTNVGTWGGTAATSTAGEFEDTVVPPGGDYEGTFDLNMVPGAGNPETRHLGELDAGECVVINTIVSYDVVDASGNPVFGANVFSDDLVYNFDYWVTWSDPGPDGLVGTADDISGFEANSTESTTVRSELSAAANKISTSTVTFSPASSVSVGETVSVTYDGVDFGQINQGFDSDGDGNDDYDLWFQAIGESSLWDPDVFQLVGIESTLTGKCGGSTVILTATDTTYFDRLDLHGNCSWEGVYTYTFLALSSGTSTVAPYQEAASGSDQEKYNGDYCGDDPVTDPPSEHCVTITASGDSLVIDKTVSPTSTPVGGTLTWTVGYTNTSTSAIGDPDSGFGVWIDDSIPASTTYVLGSASCGTLACIASYSTDGGVTYSAFEPVDPTTVTDLRWSIDVPVPAGTSDTVSFQSTVDVGTPDGLIPNDAFASFGGQPPPIGPATASACVGSCVFMTIDKDTTTPTVSPGAQAGYTITVAVDAAFDGALGVTVTDTLPAGFTYASSSVGVSDPSVTRTSTTDPSVGDSALTWGTWDIPAGESLTITFAADVAPGIPAGTYDNTAGASGTNTAVIDDLGETAQDDDTPSGEDPETDEDVTIDFAPVFGGGQGR